MMTTNWRPCPVCYRFESRGMKARKVARGRYTVERDGATYHLYARLPKGERHELASVHSGDGNLVIHVPFRTTRARPEGMTDTAWAGCNAVLDVYLWCDK